MFTESKGTLQTILPSSSRIASTKDVSFTKPSVSTEMSSGLETDNLLSSPKLSAPVFTKKAKSQGAKVEAENQTAKLDDVGKGKKIEDVKNAASNTGELKKVGEVHQVQPTRPFNPFSKSLNNQEKKSEVNQVQSNRPSNPFLKSSVK